MGEVWKHQGPGMWTCGCGSPRHRVRRRQRPGSSAPAVHPLAAEPVNHNHPIRYVTHDRSLPFVPAKPLRTSAADAFVPCRPSRCALAVLLPCRGTQRVRQRLQMPHSLVFTRSCAESSRGGLRRAGAALPPCAQHKCLYRFFPFLRDKNGAAESEDLKISYSSPSAMSASRCNYS
jgi:hypothetical protein